MEFGDRTQLGVLTLSARYKLRAPIFLGAMAAFSIVCTLGVAIGEALLSVLPVWLLSKISGIVFMALGLLTLRGLEKEGERSMIGQRRGPFASAFLMILVSEFGDKTQIAMITLAAKFGSPFEVLMGALLALGAMTAVGTLVGERIAKIMPMNIIRRTAAAIFVAIGLLTLASVIRA
jgi:putative Ca2+/H+ antiporter (TMEM165/GDT1 family)